LTNALWFLNTKINVSNEKQQIEKQYKTNKFVSLDTNVILYTEIRNFKQEFSLLDIANHITLQGEYCDISNSFFDTLESTLFENAIIYKPTLNISDYEMFKQLELGDIEYISE
jgi:hypothetical protein